MFRFTLMILLVVSLSGCLGSKTNNVGLMNQLQMRVIGLERKVEEKEREIVDLKYQVKEIASRFDSDELDMGVAGDGIVMVDEPNGMTVSSSKKVSSKNSDIIRVAVNPRDVQAALKNAGYYNGSLDGKFGPMSKKAVVEFQRNHGLTTDGIIGKNTWNEMKLYLDQ